MEGGKKRQNYYFCFVEIITSSLRKLKFYAASCWLSFCLRQDHYNPNVIQLKEPRKLSSKCKQLSVCLHLPMILLFFKQSVVIAINCVVWQHKKGFIRLQLPCLLGLTKWLFKYIFSLSIRSNFNRFSIWIKISPFPKPKLHKARDNTKH